MFFELAKEGFVLETHLAANLYKYASQAEQPVGGIKEKAIWLSSTDLPGL